jgi:CHASE1-domain containing sensor protein
MKFRLNLLWGTYLFSCLIILVISFFVERNLGESQELLMKSEFSKAQDLLVEKVDSFVHGLQGMGGLYISKNFGLAPSEVEVYARFRNNFDNFPGALGFGFIRVIPREQKLQYEQSMRSKLPHFSVVSLEEHALPHLFVIETIEPFARNQAARGLDVASETIRREAALRAIDSGRSTLTGAIQLVQTEKKQTGFLYFLPLYKTQLAPGDLESRRREIAGFSYSPILLAPLIEYLEGRGAQAYALYECV